MEKGNSFIVVFSLDQNNYQTLFGYLDNSFLVAYAIGMFIRFVLVVADSCYALSQCVVWGILSHNSFSSSQWDIWRAPTSAVLPEFRDADEWVVHMSVWPGLLLEHPLFRVLRLHPGKDTTIAGFKHSFPNGFWFWAEVSLRQTVGKVHWFVILSRNLISTTTGRIVIRV